MNHGSNERAISPGKPVVTRFAPSPTGWLHLGHVLAAKVAFDLAKQSPKGTFLLRFEDIDTTRVRESYYAGIEEDLRWLGLIWDGTPLRQTNRVAAYADALDTLRREGWIYPCFCTRREIQSELAAMTAAPHGPDGPHYPGTCRKLGERERRIRLESGMPHCWRLDSGRAATGLPALEFTDLRHGRLRVNATIHGDVVLARKDIGPAYHLAVVVDDAWQDVSHVTRGEDLLSATHVHRVLQHLLRLPEPLYLHHQLVCDESGKRLAKRHDAMSVASLRREGIPPSKLLDQAESGRLDS